MDSDIRKLRLIRERIEAHLREVFGAAPLPSQGIRDAALSPQCGVPLRASAGDKHQDQTCSDCAWGYECARTGVCQRRAQGELRSVYGRRPAA